jgi:cytochrome c oxidase cbb3-type subunit 2
VISFHTNHRLLAIVPIAVFAGLTGLIAIVPAIGMNLRYPAPDEPRRVSKSVELGRALYLKENCSACHTMQVRSDPRLPADELGRLPALGQDARYGRASRPEDYANESPPMLGSQRTGPDLANIADRIPSLDWHLTHLYDPRIVVPDSVMQAYPWYFKSTGDPAQGDRKVLLSTAAQERLGAGAEVWATKDAIALAEYMLTLKASNRAP